MVTSSASNGSGAYPSTEELLSSLSVLLNGGGLAQAQTIVAEVNNILDGNGTNVRELVTTSTNSSAP